MKIFRNKSFAKLLIFYMLIVLIITFVLISITIANSLKQFINNNAYNQSKIVASNILVTFSHELRKTESIPQNICELSSETTPKTIALLPLKILKTHPGLLGCSFHYDPTYPGISKMPNICACRTSRDSIILKYPEQRWYSKEDSNVYRTTPKGFWIQSDVNGDNIRSYCEPISFKNNIPYGILKIDLSTKALTDIIGDYKLYNSGYLFIINQQGEFIAHHDPEIIKYKNVYKIPFLQKENRNVIDNFVNGKTGYTTIYKNNIEHCFYYTPIPELNWRLGIICPYNEVLIASDKLFILLFLCLAMGLFFIFGCIILIVHRLSDPLKELTVSVRTIADGKFDTALIPPDSSTEIKDLYAAFSYMQQNLLNHIEHIKINTTEKEQFNTEMKLAQKIQRRFLPKQQQFPDKIELFGKLRQSKKVGGDLYEYFVTGNKLYFTIGDVSGKGTPAALYMASVIKLFRYVANGKDSTAEICNIINTLMCENADDDMYITMFVGIMDLDSGNIIFTNAGHPYPLILHESGTITLLEKYPDVPIGVLDDHIYEEHSYKLEINSQIILYTDGITDAENIDSQFYGKENMYDCIRRISSRNPQNIVNAILNDINCHIYGNKQSDDLTIMSILYKGGN